MIDLQGTPYLLGSESIARDIAEAVKKLGERVGDLRSSGKLTAETLKDYYGQKRFEQVAESNALEGSPLSAGETELAVLKGTTLTGHDPSWIRDAQSLDRALTRLAEMAKDRNPTDIPQVKEIHALVLGDRPSAGAFRSQPVRISGSTHKPPETWSKVMDAMEAWQTWSLENMETPALLRATVLHTWLVHIHPFADGNGRTARAIANLELIRAGYPPIIIRKLKDRDRYIDGLHASDDGDIGLLLELFQDRLEDALRDLEQSARRAQGYDRYATKIRRAQENQARIWNSALRLLAELVQSRLSEHAEAAGVEAHAWPYNPDLGVEDYIDLCNEQPISKSWCFKVEVAAPGLPRVERLAWLGFRSQELKAGLPTKEAGPSVFWSRANPGGYPKWVKEIRDVPGVREFSLVGDQWMCLLPNGSVNKLSSLELADTVAQGMLELLSSPPV